MILWPKRFGKSLLLSTLEEIYKGKGTLFKNTKIYLSNYDWPKHLVLRFDFSLLDNNTPDRFNTTLFEQIRMIGELSESAMKEPFPFTALIKAVSRRNGGRIVILIDDYDKPVVDHLHDPALGTKMRECVSHFLKMLIDQLNLGLVKAIFVTGITDIGLDCTNNFEYICRNCDFGAAFGFTSEEIVTNFQKYTREIAIYENKFEKVIREMQEWYGYQFSDGDCMM